MGGCYSPITQKKTQILKKNQFPQKIFADQPNPQLEQLPKENEKVPISIIIEQSQQEEEDEKQNIKRHALKQSEYYSRIQRHSKQQVKVFQPSQAGLSVIQRLQMQDPDSVFFKGIPKNIDKSFVKSKMSKKQANEFTFQNVQKPNSVSIDIKSVSTDKVVIS